MKTLITYGSRYGSAKRYAELFAELSEYPISSYKLISSVDGYNRVIHFGALYAGGVMGLKHISQLLSQDTELVIVTVGLADVSDRKNTDNIKKSIKSQVPNSILENSKIFHLRGAIDYGKLSLKHRIMMALLYAKAKNIPDEKRNPETKAMIETYGKQVSFVSKDSLHSIASAILQSDT